MDISEIKEEEEDSIESSKGKRVKSSRYLENDSKNKRMVPKFTKK